MATGSWWVIPEGMAGDLVNALAQNSAVKVHYTTVQAASKPNGATAGPFPTQTAAQAEATKEDASAGLAGPLQGVGAVESAITSVPQFLQGLTSGNLWIRVAKVVIGGTLILVGVAKLTGASSAITKAAGKIPVIPV